MFEGHESCKRTSIPTRYQLKGIESLPFMVGKVSREQSLGYPFQSCPSHCRTSHSKKLSPLPLQRNTQLPPRTREEKADATL